MKKLKVFKNLDTDIFFAPALNNSAGRVEPIDRAKCYYWERERTICLLYPQITEFISLEHETYKLIEEERLKGLKFSKKKKNRLDFLRSGGIPTPDPEIIKNLMGTTKQFYPYAKTAFPKKAYLNIDLDIREDWECPLYTFEFKNITRSAPSHYLHNLDENDQMYCGSIESYFQRQIYVSSVSSSAESYEEELIRDKIPVSAKVEVPLYIDPTWKVGTLRRSLIDNLRLIKKVADLKKAEAEQEGQKFSNAYEFEEKRHLRTIHRKLNLLGHFRLLECEKWSWGEVTKVFTDKDSEENKKTGINPIAFETYKENIREIFPYYKHSHIS